MGHWAGDAAKTFGAVEDAFFSANEWVPFRFYQANTKLSSKLHAWEDIAKFRAVFFFPWDLQLTSFPELYSLHSPIFVPDFRWVHHIVLRAFAAPGSVRQWWGFRTLFNGTLPSAVGSGGGGRLGTFRNVVIV